MLQAGSDGCWNETHRTAFENLAVRFDLQHPPGLGIPEALLGKNPLRLVDTELIQPGNKEHDG